MAAAVARAAAPAETAPAAASRVDAALQGLQAKKKAWVQLPLAKKIELLKVPGGALQGPSDHHWLRHCCWGGGVTSGLHDVSPPPLTSPCVLLRVPIAGRAWAAGRQHDSLGRGRSDRPRLRRN